MIIAVIDPAVQVALVGAGGVAVGSFLAAAFNYLTTRAARRYEERRIIYDIAGKLAAEQWKLDVERTDAFNKTLGEGSAYRPRSNLTDFQLPIPHIAQTVRGIIDELERSTRPKSYWARFRDWRSQRKK